MRKLPMLTAILILALLLGLTFAAGVPAQEPAEKAPPGVDTKEEVPFPKGTVPEVACPLIEGTISCGDTIPVDTTGNADTMSLYSCSLWDESGPEEVYELTLPAGGPWHVTAAIANNSADLDVFALGGTCDSDNCVGHGDFDAAFTGAGEATFWISVDGYGGASGTADLTITCALAPEPAPNDECTEATVVAALPFHDYVDTTAATVAPDDPIVSCGGMTHSNTVWYVYTAAQDGLVDLSTCGSDYDTVLAVWEGTCGALTELECDDDSCYPQSQILGFPVTAESTYYIEVADYGVAGGGNLTFDMSLQGDPDIAVDPSSLSAEMCPDEQSTTELTICNEGIEPLAWTLFESPPGSPVYDVLLVSPDSTSGDISLLLATLASFPDLNVTVWDNTSGNPAPGDMLPFDVVLFGNDITWEDALLDKVVIGDSLADYIDSGGKAMESLYVQSFDEWGFGGRYMTEGYSPFTPASTDYWLPDSMEILGPSHPVMTGVLTIADNFGHQNPGLAAEALALAGWSSSGYYAVAANSNVVALNQLVFHYADWTGDVGTLLHNAIVWLSGGELPDLPWLSEDPTGGTVDPDLCDTVTVGFDSTGLDPGAYTGDLLVLSNDPDEPQVIVPVTLDVLACENTIHVDGITGVFVTDVYGRPILRSRVWVADQAGVLMPDVLVEASIWSPCGGPVVRFRYTRPSGAASFPWGCSQSGLWTVCVDDLTLAGYTYEVGDNVVTCVDWSGP